MTAKPNLFAQGTDFTIFKNESAFYPEFLPEDLPGREAQVREVTEALKPLIKGQRATNLLLYGGTGTGKTACAKYVSRELESYTPRVKVLYLNCFEYNSRHAILTKIANAIGCPTPRKGGSTDEMFDSLVQYLPKSEKTVLVILDELDQLLKSDEASKLLYDLLRMSEYKVSPIPFIAVTNDVTLTMRLDARVRSSLLERQVEFKPYTPLDLKKILRERASLALREGYYEEDSLALATAYGAESGGDVRIAIEVLWKGAKLAEARNSMLKAEHVKQAFSSRVDHKAGRALAALSEGEKQFLSDLLPLLQKKGSITSGDLYSLYERHSKAPLSERTIRLYVSRLTAFNVLKSSKAALDKGRSQVISLNMAPEKVRELL